MEEFVKDFVAETSESLGALDNDLLRLEIDVGDLDLVARIFRTVHTIKGTCGFLGLNRLRRVAHATENVLDAIRKGRIAADTAVVTTILQAFDSLKEITEGLGANGFEGDGDDSALIAALDAIYEPTLADPQAPAEAPAVAAAEPPPAESPAEPAPPDSEEALAAAWDPTPHASPAPPAAPAPAPMRAAAPPPAPAPSPAPAAAPSPAAPAAAAPAARAAAPAASDQSIRVNLALLETLMTSVSELVLTRNQLMQLARNNPDPAMTGPLQRLNQVVSELQGDVMKTRMQPIGNAWNKLPRIVRDLARDLDKKIELQMSGAETELDRQILELIRDPLTHMIRNSCDHGLEDRAGRLAAGKDETGIIRLHAFHEGGHIVMKLSDDGRGLDLVRIRAKAVERGLASEAEVAAMTDTQVGHFIFRAGFSTAAAVTDVSGRGVGMDVVRTNVERIGGTIDLATTQGQGSVFTIKIPLTLAIISALIVDCAGQRYAMPQISVTELVHAGTNGEHRIERIRGTAVLRLRERLLPLVPLREILGLDAADPDTTTSHLVIVTQVGSYEFGIVVDRAYDTEEVVVKPVAPLLKEVSVYSGNTILGDGAVCMIIDAAGVLARAGRVDTSAAAAAATKPVAGLLGGMAGAPEKQALLLVRAGSGMVKAIPLDLIARLEEVAADDINHSNGHMLIKYRDRLMPLIVADPEVMLSPGSRKPVLVFSEGERSVGLVVDEIEDIVESGIEIELETGRPEIFGSAIVNGRPTEIINTGYFLTQASQDWFNPPRQANRTPGKRVLMVDDSAFFRSLMAPVLRACNLEVVPAGSGEEALARLNAGERIDLVVTDIEMPGIDGYALARALKADPRWAALPIIGLSGQAGEEELARGQAAGFIRHLPKLGRDGIAQAINEIMVPEYLA